MAPDSAAKNLCRRRAQRQVSIRPTSNSNGTAHHRSGLQEVEEATASAEAPQPQGPSPQATAGRGQDNAHPTAAASDTENRLITLMGRKLVAGQAGVKESRPVFPAPRP